MANIPMGEFAQARVVPRAETRRLDTSALDQRGAGGQAIGHALAETGFAGLRMQAQEREQEKREAEAIAAAKAANAYSAYQLEVQAAVDDVGDQLRRGGDYNKAGDLYEETISKIEPPQIEGLTPERQEAYGGGISNARTAGKLRVSGLATQARRDDGQAQFAKSIDLAGKLAAAPGANVEAINRTILSQAEEMVQLFGIDKSVAMKAAQDRIDGNWINHALQQFNGSTESVDALRKLQNDVTADDGYYAGKLDPEKRNVIAARIGSRIDVLEGKAEREAMKADTRAERALSAMDEQVSSGVPGTVEQWTGWAEVMRGASPELQQEFRERVEGEKDVQAVLRKPIADQQAELRAREAALLTQGGDKRTRTNVARLQKAVQANVKMLTDSPLQFARARGGETVPPLDLAAVARGERGVLGAALQKRAELVDGLRKQYGPQVKARLLLPEEASGLSALLDRGSPQDKLALFATMKVETGSARTYNAVMAQIAPDSPVLAHAGALALRNEKAARLLVEGEALLNRSKGDAAQDGKFKTVKLPEQAEIDTAFSEAVGNAFRGRPEAYSMAMQAVRAGYAGATSRDGDVSGVVDPKRMENIIRATLGETVNFNDRGAVFVPYGMPPDDFEDAVESTFRAIVPQLADKMPGDLDEYALEQIGDGRYYLKLGRSYAPGRDGQPLVLDVVNGPRWAPESVSEPGTVAGGAGLR